MSNQREELDRYLQEQRPNIAPDIIGASARMRPDYDQFDPIRRTPDLSGKIAVTVNREASNEFAEKPAPVIQEFGSIEEAARAFAKIEPDQCDRVSLSVGGREFADKSPIVSEVNGREVVTGEAWNWRNHRGDAERKAITYPDPTPTRPERIPGQEVAAKVEEKEARHLQIVAVRAERADAADKVQEAAREVLGDQATKEAPQKVDDFDQRLKAAREAQRDRSRSREPGRYREI